LSIEGLFGLRSCDDRALEGMRMRSPDLPEILITAGLVACIACAVSNWLHRREQGLKSQSRSSCGMAAQASERAAEP
jgi:hypothetical protein